MNKHENANRVLWDELTEVHVKSYGVDKFKAGQTTLDEIQLRDLGDMKGKTVLHLQCHFGLDTLSLAREGAIVTGVDFSEKGIHYARRLSGDTGIPARFIHSNIYDLANHLDEKFDIVYTTQGVLCWLKDIKEWGRIVAKYLKHGGFLYLMETHPILNIFNDTISGRWEIIHSYFHKDEPKMWDDHAPDYSDPSHLLENTSFEWQWTISDIVNSLISVGLEIEFINEYDKTFYKALPGMVRDTDGWWVLPDFRGKLPLMFTLRAHLKHR
jgi:SAM-dependent methyltransferase